MHFPCHKLLRLPVCWLWTKGGRRLWNLPWGSLRSFFTWKTRQCYRNRASVGGVAACFSPMPDGFCVSLGLEDFEAAISHNSSRWEVLGGLWGGYVFQGRKGEFFFLLCLIIWIFSHFVEALNWRTLRMLIQWDQGMEGMKSKQQRLPVRHRRSFTYVLELFTCSPKPSPKLQKAGYTVCCWRAWAMITSSFFFCTYRILSVNECILRPYWLPG